MYMANNFNNRLTNFLNARSIPCGDPNNILSVIRYTDWQRKLTGNLSAHRQGLEISQICK
jgi:hypothetical protein